MDYNDCMNYQDDYDILDDDELLLLKDDNIMNMIELDASIIDDYYDIDRINLIMIRKKPKMDDWN